jgi:CspA family cold shock protein
MVIEGEVKWFSNEKGFGFIHPVLEDDKVAEDVEYFVHYTSVKMNGFKTLQTGQRVYFKTKDTDRGVQAIDVEPI